MTGKEVQRIREKLPPRGIEVAGTFCADDAFRLWQSEGSWDMVLTEYDIAPGKRIRDATELMKEIRAAKPSQLMAIQTSDEGLLAAPVPVLRKPYAIERLLRMLRLPVLPLGQPPKAQ